MLSSMKKWQRMMHCTSLKGRNLALFIVVMMVIFLWVKCQFACDDGACSATVVLVLISPRVDICKKASLGRECLPCSQKLSSCVSGWGLNSSPQTPLTAKPQCSQVLQLNTHMSRCAVLNLCRSGKQTQCLLETMNSQTAETARQAHTLFASFHFQSTLEGK